MSFPLARETIEGTKSWNIIKKMPKGALLHSHADATLDVVFLVEQALGTPGMCLSATTPLVSDEDRRCAKLSFRFRKSVDAS